MKFSINRVKLEPCYRIIPSRFSSANLADKLANTINGSNAVNQALTNENARRTLDPSSVNNIIMSSFVHLNPAGSRFSDGSYGLLYAADNVDTAIAETSYHRQKFMQATNLAAIELEMTVYAINLNADLVDLRGLQLEYPELYDPTNYQSAQILAKELKYNKISGIIYDSVRSASGSCVAIFRSEVLSNCFQQKYLTFKWDGEKICQIYEKQPIESELSLVC